MSVENESSERLFAIIRKFYCAGVEKLLAFEFESVVF
jgi:hypothetical protein